jgi:mono/diheme cytochrome c family protein
MRFSHTLCAPALLAVLSAGCGVRYSPEPFSAAPPPDSAGSYPLRTDLMVIKLLDGAPTHWPANGFPPLRSARNPTSTPDRDIAEDLRKQFGKNILDPAKDLTAAQAADLDRLMDDTFGSPAEPRVRLQDWDDVVVSAVVRPRAKEGAFANLKRAEAAFKKWKWKPVREDWETAKAMREELNLDDAALARGSVVYRRWCMQCHGPTGAGDGAHAITLAAPPRDYRQGIFKFVTAFPDPSTITKKKGRGPGGKPRRDDLKRTVRKGLDGSMMPAFPTLSEQELDDVVSYVIHLAVRGETEFATLTTLNDENSDDYGVSGPALRWLFEQNEMWVLVNWEIAARSEIPVPPEYTPTDEDRLLSAIRGYKLYNSAEFGCAACHVNYGREPQLKWDFWGTVVQPRNLTLGVYRGGRRGEDLYARLYGGIYPSGMTAFHTTLKTGPSYLDRPDKIWNVVHFLQALADPQTRRRMQDPAVLARFKQRLRADNDLFLEDLAAVRIDP